MSLQFDSNVVKPIEKEQRTMRLSIPNEEKGIDYITAGTPVLLKVGIKKLDYIVPNGKRLSLRLIAILEDV